MSLSPDEKSRAPLTPPLFAGLRAAQASFHVYQSAAFDERPASFFVLELAGETGELCNLEKKIWRNGEAAVASDRLADEAADVIITLLNYCNARGIDLEEAVRAKLATIEDRRVRGLMGPTKAP